MSGLKHRATGESLVQPERLPDDLSVEVRIIDSFISISTGEGPQRESILVSGFNAWRIFGMLGFILGFNLPKSIQKAIKF